MINIDLGSAHPNVKSLLILTVLLPFWYITLHIFHPNFFNRSDLILKIAYCLCLSFCSSILYGRLIMESEDGGSEKGFFHFQILAISTIAQISWQSILIFIFYLYAEFNGEIVLFSTFLTIYITPGLLYNIVSFVEHKLKDEKK